MSGVQAVSALEASLGATAADRRRTLWLLSIVAAFNTIDRQVMSILSAPIKAEFGLTDGQVGALGLIYGLLFAVGAAPLAALANATSRRAVIAGCMAAFSAATAVCGLAVNYAMVLASRVGVALGEAGTTAPSHSLISDLYTREQRTMALSQFTAATKVGAFVAFLAGGWLGQLVGWRATFLILGIPGIIIGLIAWYGIREPGAKAATAEGPPPAKAASMAETFRYIARTPSFWHIFAGKALWSLYTLGLIFWMPHYLRRAFDVPLGVIGTFMAFYALIFGGGGVMILGWVAQRLQRRDERWLLGSLVITAFIGTAFVWWALFTPDVWVLAAAATVPVFIYSSFLSPTAAASQAVVPATMRTTTAGYMQVALGIVGMGMGPFLPGLLSDALEGRYGDLSIRYSLAAFSICWLWAAAHFLLANRTLKRDIERADAVNGQMA